MHPALCPACLDGIAANAAPVVQQAFRVCCHVLHAGARHLNVRSAAKQVLAALGAAHLGVVCGGAVAAGNGHCLAEMLPDTLEQQHQRLVHKDLVRTILAAKLPHAEVRCQQLCPVLGKTILSDHLSTSFPYSRFSSAAMGSM